MDNLVKKLAYLSDNACSIITQNWNTYNKISEGVKEKKFKLYSITTNNTRYPEDKLIELLEEKVNPEITTNNHIWATYKDCVRIRVSKFYDELFLRVIVYDGRLLDGFPEKERFGIVVIAPMNFIYEMENLIEDAFEDQMNKEYEEYLYNQKLKWMKQREDNIMIQMELHNQWRKA